jgi:hypothetical protein
MTICPHSKHACECQPQEGIWCPHGTTPKDFPDYEYQTLMKFYNVSTEIELIKAMENHIAKLQEKLREEHVTFRPIIRSRLG